MAKTHTFWAVVVAAGIGRRMEEAKPKQYLPLLGRTVLDVTLEKLLTLKNLAGVVVALHAEDSDWQNSLLFNHPKIVICLGGKERSDSVSNALALVKEYSEEGRNTWVLVHDAARPCVTREKIEALCDLVVSENCGAILAAPVADTLKRVVHGNLIASTEDRTQLWQAHTPQVFLLEKLQSALHYCSMNGLSVTDEASAIEHAGGRVLIMADRRDNIKITMPEDLAWAEFILKNQE